MFQKMDPAHEGSEGRSRDLDSNHVSALEGGEKCADEAPL